MDDKLVKQTVDTKVLSRKASLLLAAVLVVAVAVGALALLRPIPSPDATPGAASAATASARLLALDQGLFAVAATPDSANARNARLRAINEALYPDEAVAAAVVAATRRQEELKDRWLERGNAANEVAAPAEREMFEQHKYLAQQSEADAIRHWNEMKARGGVGNRSQ